MPTVKKQIKPLRCLAALCFLPLVVGAQCIPAISESPPSTNWLNGSLTLSGGLNQSNGSNYASVTMTLQGNPGVTATLSTAPFTHNETVNFVCPQAGTYTVVATDGNGCSGTASITVNDNGGGNGINNGSGLPTGDCWTWQNPLPQGNTLRDVFFVNAQTGWAVGDAGTILKTVNGGATWTAQTSGIAKTLLSVYFTDTHTGWAVGSAGEIIKTNDSGQTWITQNSGTTNSLWSVHFADNQTGWVVSGGGRILKTINGGQDWITQSVGNPLLSVYFVDHQVGWFVGANGIILKTSDGGQNLTLQNSGTNISLSSVLFINSEIGWVAGDNGTILKTTDSGLNWTKQITGISNNLQSVHFADSQTGWAVGSAGRIIKTTNGGENWIIQNSGTGNGLNDVCFANNQTGWAVGAAGIILKTSNGGQNWLAQNSGTTNRLESVMFSDNQTGWAVGYSGRILKTTNGGQTWISQNSGTGLTLFDVHFADSQTGWVVGLAGNILKTSNGGQTWIPQSSGTTNTLRSIKFTDNQMGWIVGEFGTILFTTDGGENWISLGIGMNNSFFDVHFINNQTGWVVGSDGVIIKITNGGQSWAPQNSGANNWLYSVHFADSQSGWAVGTDGIIIKTSDGGQNWKKQISNTISSLQDVYAINNQIAWIVGQNHIILKTSDGGQHWISQNPGTYEPFFGLQFKDSQTGWAVGDRGTILKYTPSIPSCLPTIPLYTQTNIPTDTTLAWPEASGCEDGYRLRLSTTPGGANLLDTTFVGIITSFKPAQPLPAGDTIYMRITPYNDLGDASGCGEFWFVTASGCPTPAQASFTEAVNGLSVAFTNTSVNGITYQWDFGDGNTSTSASPTHTYAAAGFYTVRLIASGDCDADTLTRIIQTAPVAGFTVSPTAGCEPLTVQFTNTSSANATGFSWQFPGGLPAVSSQNNPVVVYQTPGVYTATLMVFNAVGGDTITQTNIISVEGLPTADFNITVNQLTVQFNNTSSSATGYQWNLGDGNSSTLANPVHTYAAAGTYTVCLTSSGNCGIADTCTAITITGNTCNPTSDSLELVKLYNATNGPGWANSTHWLTPGQPITTWHGISVSAQGCVTSILLQGKTIAGILPDLILPELQTLSVLNASLQGSLPPFSNTPALRYLYLTDNLLQGNLPDFSFSTNLELIDIDTNQLSGSLPNLDHLVNLSYLDLNNNVLSGGIPDFGSLLDLEYLDLGSNHFSGQAPTLPTLNKLTFLGLGANRLEGSVPDWDHLNKLERLYLNNNKLSGPLPLFSSPSMIALGLDRNRFTFDGLEALVNKAYPEFTYSPQDSVYADTMISRDAGDFLEIDLQIDSQVNGNVHTWYKNGQVWFPPSGNPPGSNKLVFANLQADDSGVYHVQITNPAMPLLTLYGRAITLNVTCSAPPLIQITGPTTLCSGTAELSAPPGFTQYTWSNGASTPTITATDTGTYTVTVTDANGCRGTATQNVGPSVPAPSPQINGPTILCSGAAELTATAGFAQYAWSNGTSTSTITATAPGAYAVTVTDANGCRGTATQNVSPSVPAPSPQITGPIALCSGAAELTATTGFSQYAWSSGQNTPTINATQSGAYTVTVTDANGCTGTAVQNVGSNVPAPSPQITGPINLCSGSAELAAPPGLAQYAWSTGASTPTITTTDTGAYTVTVTDANGCRGTATQNVGPSVPAPAPQITGPTTLCSGTAELSAPPGFTQYAWSTGAGTSTITATAPGTYVITVTDANGCRGVDSVVLNDNVVITATAVGTPGSCIAPASLSGASNLPAAVFLWGGPGGFQSTLPSPTPGAPGVYTLLATDPAGGCTATAQVTVSTDTTAPTLALSGADLNCTSTQVALSAVAGPATVAYAWSGPANFQSADPAPVATLPGVYAVTVTDPANGCTAAGQVTVGMDTIAPVVNATGATIGCNNPLVYLQGTSDRPGSTFAWTYPDGQTILLQNPPTIVPGVYTLTITGPNGCTATDTAEVYSAPQSATVSITGTPLLCPGESTLLTATPGFDNYLWSTGQSGSAVGPVGPGAYAVTATLSNGCSGTAAFVVTEAPAPVAGLAPVGGFWTPGDTLRVCAGTPAVFSASGGTSYRFSIDGVPTGPPDFSNNFARVFNQDAVVSVWVRNGAGCTDVTVAGDGPGFEPVPVAVVAALPPMKLDIEICKGDSLWLGGKAYTQSGTYQVVLPANAGCDTIIDLKLKVGDFILRDLVASICIGETFVFNGQALTQNGLYRDTIPGISGCDTLITLALSVSNSPSMVLPPVTLCQGQSVLVADSLITQSGFYQIRQVSATGCDTLFLVQVTEDPLALQPFADTTLCDPASEVKLTALTNSPCPACKYTWNTGSSAATVSVEPDNSQPYAVTVTNGATGCSWTQSVWVRSQEFIYTETDTVICAGESVWFGGVLRDQSGEYNAVQTSAAGCDSTTVLLLTVLDQKSVVAIGDTVFLPPGEPERIYDVAANDLSVGGAISLSLTNEPVHGAANPTSDNRVRYKLIDLDFVGIDSVTYRICDVECPDVCSSATLYVVAQDNLESLEERLPTAFSPNDDGNNDLWDPLQRYIDQGYIVPTDRVEMSIISRWGELIVHYDPYQPWDGKVGGRTAPTGTYYYVLRLQLGKEIVVTKPVTVLR